MYHRFLGAGTPDALPEPNIGAVTCAVIVPMRYEQVLSHRRERRLPLNSCRRSVSEFSRSRRRFVGSDSTRFELSMLFCSGASSMACDQVYVANASNPREKRLFNERSRW